MLNNPEQRNSLELALEPLLIPAPFGRLRPELRPRVAHGRSPLLFLFQSGGYGTVPVHVQDLEFSTLIEQLPQHEIIDLIAA